MFLAKIADLVRPGSMIATRMPKGASSWASPSLNPSNAHFEVTYGDWAIAATRPVTDVMLTMQPRPCWRMCGSTACRQRTAPHRLTFMNVEVQRRWALLGDGVATDAGIVDEVVDAAGGVEDAGGAVEHR